LLICLVFVVVDSHDVDRDIVLRRSRDDDLLGTTLKMESSFLFAGEGSSGLSDVVSTNISPLDC
jgi:hypothetical protein